MYSFTKYKYIDVYIYMYLCACVYIYIFIYVYIYICMHACIHTLRLHMCFSDLTYVFLKRTNPESVYKATPTYQHLQS